MILAAALADKRLNTAWAVGAAAGMLDTGAIATNVTYHIFLIQRSDTGVVDLLASLSPTGPTMPASYDRKAWIGAVTTDATPNIEPFHQDRDYFYRDVPAQDYRATSPGTAGVTRTLSVPTGIGVQAIHMSGVAAISVGTAIYALITALDQPDTAPDSTVYHVSSESGGEGTGQVVMLVRTNTSGQIRTRVDTSAASIRVFGTTIGWIAPRGRKW